MKQVTLTIPDAFEEDFDVNRFGECFGRVLADLDHVETLLIGRYEKETLEMLMEAFRNAKVEGEQK